MKDLIKLQIFRVSVSLGVLVSLLFFMIIAPSLKTTNSEEPADTTCDTSTVEDKTLENSEEFKPTIKTPRNISKSKRNKLRTLLNVLKAILEEELKCSQINETKEETIDNNKEIEIEQQGESLNGTVEEQICNISNKSFDCNKILERITTALERSKVFSNARKNKEKPTLISTFRSTPTDDQISFEHLNTNNPTQYLNPTNQLNDMPPIPMAKLVVKLDPPATIRQSNPNPITTSQKFIIPCQRASDILDDSYFIPKGAYCSASPTTNLQPNIKVVGYNFQHANPVSSVFSYKETDDNVAMLFKPKAVSLMQVYGNLLKKLTVTVLVPYYVSKLEV